MPGEPPHGVLARLAMRHREPDVAAFASVHGCPLTGVLQGRSLGVLADLIGIGLDALRVHAPSLDVASRLVSVAGQQLLLNDWSTKTRRWCRRCLREDRMAARLDGQARHPGPWHRASWDNHTLEGRGYHGRHRVEHETRAGEVPAFFGPDGAACSSKSVKHNTPQWVVQAVLHALDLEAFDLDPCAPEDGGGHVLAKRKMVEADDGLTGAWKGKVFVNPPYARNVTRRWVSAAAWPLR